MSRLLAKGDFNGLSIADIRPRFAYIQFYAIAFLLAFPSAKDLAAAPVSMDSLPSMSLEELLNLPVTTASKKAEAAFETASSIHVITQEEIRRAGAVNIPEALRLAPGLHVARKDTNHYVITSRGFNDLPFSDKLLVMIDGRAVYSPTFSQVWWPAITHPVEDIERIEVILGPGSALWGANAINGIINIITKQAKDAGGTNGTIGAGNAEKGYGFINYGWRPGGNADVKVYASASDVDGGRIVGGEWSDAPSIGRPAETSKKALNAGFRADWSSESSAMSLSGEAYRVEAGSEGAVFVDYHQDTEHFQHKDLFEGKSLLLRMVRGVDQAFNSSFQLFYDSTNTKRIFYSELLDMVDAEAQVNYSAWEGNVLTAGLDFRNVKTRFTSGKAMSMPDVSDNIIGLFLQDEHDPPGGILRLIAGAKAEKNDYSKWQFQPSIKAAVNGESWMGWVSAARTVRLSNPVNKDFVWNFESNTYKDLHRQTSIKGSSDAMPEEAMAYEIGMRGRPSENLGVDIAAFYTQYPNVLDIVTIADPSLVQAPDPHYEQDKVFHNVYQGVAYGGEISIKAQMAHWMRAFLGYAYTRVALKPKPGQESHQEEADWINTATPVNSMRIGLFIDLPYRLRLDPVAYFVDATPGVTANYYHRFDLRLAWMVRDDITISIQGRNIGGAPHKEHESAFMEDSVWISQDYSLKASFSF